MKKKFKVGDKVRVKASPRNLPDPNYVGKFNWEEPLDIVYTISRDDGYNGIDREPSYKLAGVGWWWDGSWLVPANNIYLGGE